MLIHIPSYYLPFLTRPLFMLFSAEAYFTPFAALPNLLMKLAKASLGSRCLYLR